MDEELNKENLKSIIDFSGRYAIYILTINDMIISYNRNLTESSEELMNIFMNYPEVIELDLSNNSLKKLPLEISFLKCLTKLDIRNNNFSNVINLFYKLFFQFEEVIKILMTIKSLTILDIDLIDSNEAILVLNNLPNVQILNGKSTRD